MQIELIDIEKLIPYAMNARTHSDAQVAQIAGSIKEFGFTNPCLIDEENGLIAGHGRVMAARKLKINEIPCIRLAHLSEVQKKAYILADNRIAMNSGWDIELLKVELEKLKIEDVDLNMLGFDDVELNGILEPEIIEGKTDEDAVPEVPEVPKTKLGDIYILGKHRLMCGDSTSIDAVEKLMDGYKADLIITDPPYNVAYEGKTKDALTIQNDSMTNNDFYKFLYDVYVALFAVTKDGAGIYVFHADSEGMNFRKAMLDAGWKLAQCCIWVKQTLVMGRQDYHWQHEPVLYGWKPTGSHRWFSDRKQTTLWKFDRPSRNDVHPTMKPIDLIMYPIKNSSGGGDIVLDLFGGSGSTLIACEKTGRVNRSMELDPKYCDVIVKRWEDFTGEKAQLITVDE